MLKIIIRGNPITKKNSMRIVRMGQYSKIIPSVAYMNYKEMVFYQIGGQYKDEPINTPVNVKCVYYMKTRRKVDLLNLMSATLDLLVDLGILEDDNSRIVKGHDGSRVYYDKENPRVEITIEGFKED